MIRIGVQMGQMIHRGHKNKLSNGSYLLKGSKWFNGQMAQMGQPVQIGHTGQLG